MWIMLREKLPTNPSPPKMSIFWSVPWVDMKHVESQRIQLENGRLEDLGGDIYFEVFGFKEARWDQARMIVYKDEQIRVFPHEFSILTIENMKMYLEKSHELVPTNVAEQDIMDSILRGNRKRIYDAALVDGCTEYEARLMTIGVDVSSGHFEIPAIGWYKINPEYGCVFCTEKELGE